MARAKAKRKFKARMMILVPICLVCVLTLSLSIGRYWVNILSLYNESSNLQDELVKLKEEESVLNVDVLKLQDPDYIARYAREKYFYSGENEIILHLPGE